MDIQFFTQQLKTIDTKIQTIYNTFQYCWVNKSSCADIVKMIEKQFNQCKKDQKMAFFFLIDILLENSAIQGELTYVKALGVRIKPMVLEFIKYPSYYCRTNDNLPDITNLVKLIQKWHGQQIFAVNFTSKLRDVVDPIYKRLLDAAEQQKPQQQFMKYNKTFLIDYLAIEEFDLTRHQYEDYYTWTEVSSKVNKFNQEFKKLDFESPTPDMKMRSSELIRIGEEYRVQLLKLIESVQFDYNNLSRVALEHIAELAKETSGEHEEEERKQNFVE